MDKLLTWRVALPSLATLAVLPYVVNRHVTDLALVLTVAFAVFAAVRGAAARRGQGRLMMVLLAFAWLGGLGMVTERFLRDGSATALGAIGGAIAGVFCLLAALVLVRARRPADWLEGLADAFAVLLGIVAIHWQWLALDGRDGLEEIGASTAAAVGLYTGLTAALFFLGLLHDRRVPRALPLAVVSLGILLGVAIVATETYSLKDAPAWGLACCLMGEYLVAGFIAHPRFDRMLEPEPPRPRRFHLRWVGPVCALVATPLMMGVFVVRGAVPTVQVAVAAFVLTAVALWRGTRLIRDREKTRRELLAEQRFRALVEHAADVVLVLDSDLRVTYAGGGVDFVHSSRDGGIEGTRITELIEPAQATALLGTLARVGAGESRQVRDDLKLRRTDREGWVSVLVTNHLETPTIGGWVLNIHDVTERKQAEAALSRMALEDSLTGLPNRTSMREHLAEALLAHPGQTALLFCDLDGFKAVNDEMGHESGDDVLRAVVSRWAGELRPEDVLGRWGGDEFLVVCRGVASVPEAKSVAQRLEEALADPMQLSRGMATVGVSIGIAVHRPGVPLEELLARADADMYRAKRARTGLVVSDRS